MDPRTRETVAVLRASNKTLKLFLLVCASYALRWFMYSCMRFCLHRPCVAEIDTSALRAGDVKKLTIGHGFMSGQVQARLCRKLVRKMPQRHLLRSGPDRVYQLSSRKIQPWWLSCLRPVHGRQIHCEPRLDLRGLRLWHLLGRAWLGLLALQVAKYQLPLFASVIGGPLSGTDVACVIMMMMAWQCGDAVRALVPVQRMYSLWTRCCILCVCLEVCMPLV